MDMNDASYWKMLEYQNKHLQVCTFSKYLHLQPHTMTIPTRGSPKLAHVVRIMEMIANVLTLKIVN